MLATVVVAPYSPERATVPLQLPEGFDARITFDPARAKARAWPAIDPSRTSSKTYPDARHEQIANAARSALADYTVLDPTFSLRDPSTFDNPSSAEGVQALVRYLTHSFRPFELLSASPAADTPIAAVLDAVEELLAPIAFATKRR